MDIALSGYLSGLTNSHPMGDYPQVYTVLYSSLDEYQSPFKGTVRTPTVVPSRRQGQSRLLAPFYDGYTYP